MKKMTDLFVPGNVLQKLGILFFLVLLVSSNSGLKLDSDGGYHVSVGLEGTEPEDTVAFLDTIQTDMEALSDLMFSSTESNFHLKSVTVVIPPDWDHVAEEVTEGENFSDLKLWEGTQVPIVRRSTQCGQPGSQILLPLNFFSPANQAPRDRSLLHYWAQYRWGMFQESGFPYNTRFPYFVQREELGDWEANACTDQTLTGAVQFPNGTSCPIDEEAPPTAECRFIPEDPQPEVVHSSLLTHFHHLMDSFCTSETHQATLPTPHNVFCSGQSAWDVLLGSDDFKRVTQPAPGTRPPVTFTTTKASTLPLIHFIFDARVIHQMPEDAFERIKVSLRAIFDVGSGVNEEGFAAVTIFPAEAEDGQLTQQTVAWTKVAGSANEFRLSIDKISTIGTTHAHFGLALRLVSEDIRARRHPTGSFIFIFKGSTGSNFDEMPFEDEVLSSLLAHKVQVHAVEVSHGPLDPGTNLVHLTEISGGSHFTLTSFNIGAQFDTFLRNFILATKSPDFVAPSVFPLAAMVGTEVELAFGHDSPLRLRLTTPLEMGQVEVVGPTGSVVPIDETRSTPEWNEGKAQGRRRSLSIVIPSAEATKGSVWRINCVDGRVTNCSGFFAVYADSPPTRSKNVEDISLSVTAHFDEHLTGLLYIYALLEEGGESLVRLDSVGEYDAIASICLQTRPDDCWNIRLRDDGAGTPDLLADDGVMSGASLPPPRDAVYQVRVALSYRYNFTPPRGKDVTEEGPIFPCAFSPQAPIELCVGRYPSDSFQMVSAYPQPIEIYASTTPSQSKPSRTFDLSLISLPGGGLTLAWTAPSIFLPENVIESADAYDLRFSTNWDSLVGDFNGCVRIEIDTIPATPGVKEEVTITGVDPSLPVFFGLKSKFEDTESELSNVAWGRPSQDEGSSTTETVSAEDTTAIPRSTTTEAPTTQEATSPTPTESTATTQSTTEASTQTTVESTTKEATTNESTPTTTDDSTTQTSEEPTTEEPTASTDDSTAPTSEEPTTDASTTPTSDPSTTEESTTPTSEQPTTEESTTETSEEPTTEESTTETTEEPTTEESTTETSEEPTTEESTTETSEEPTTEEPTASTDDSTSPTSDEPTTDDSTTSEEPSTGDSTTPDPTTQESTGTTASTVSTTILTTPPPVVTEKPEYFFKTTVGYVTAGAIALVCLAGMGAVIGLLCWKRRAISLALAARSANQNNI